MSRNSSVEVEFVAPEAEITLEGNSVQDSTGTFRVLTLPDDAAPESGVDLLLADEPSDL